MVNRRAFIAASALGPIWSSKALAQSANRPLASANTPSPPSTAGMQCIVQLQDTGRYLPVLQAAEQLSRINDPFGQAAECFNLVGEDRLALINDERSLRVTPPKPERLTAAHAALADAVVAPAIDAIAERVRGRQIVIINEAHITARHRVFTLALAKRLRTDGFTWFAAETLRPPVAEFGPGSPFTRKMGWWTNEATFAEVMRHVHGLGYHIAAYDYEDPGDVTPDDDAGRNRQREDRAARHLVENVLQKDPSARVLIHVGYNHLSKDPNSGIPGWGPSFAVRVQERSGIEPFCIDQVAGTPASAPELDRPYLAEVLTRFNPQEPVVVRAPDGRQISPLQGKHVDETVFHPRYADVSGRPGWRMLMPDVRPVRFDAGLALRHQCRLAVAFRSSEHTSEAVPADIRVLNASASEHALILSPGPYRLRGENADGFVDLGELVV